ncbi:bestrophin-1-like isoform X1 [Amphibalanus amphitrite]|uniref:bestrophin-1-like isoform X1 n=1 Tax=Amphibalanus amphitrite TaxID=1232801 RepID=UPI001C90F0FE|nr:bestrophin-1-like isoform X1 [Amphibalanus amphitrite]
MTVSYQNEVASSTSGGFTRLLLKWRGSLYKLIYRELALFCLAYASVSLVYFKLLTEDQQRVFEQIRDYCNQFISLIPLSFVLGFYVTFVAQRWWQQYTAIPWPDKILHAIALYVRGADENSRMIRRTMVRYLNLSLILLLRSISSAVKRRLPTLDHLVESGFMTAQELEEFTSVPRKEFNTYWIPCCWFVSLLREARTTNHVVDSMGLKLIVETFNEYRANCGLLWSYDWVSIPLVYTQVVTIATYTFFVACLVGRQQEIIQLADSEGKPAVQLDLYLPFFTILQFLFYMGLLKVAEQLINPFGDDDEDFELNWIIDRHVKVSYLIVDTLNIRRPPLVKDMYFDDPGLTLPYTEASVQYKIPTYRGSVDNMKVPVKEHTMVLPEIKEEQDDDESENFFGSTSLGSIAAENGLIDGRDPRVGAMSVPDEALLASRNHASPNGGRVRPKNRSESAGSCGSVFRRPLDHSSAEATPQADRTATWRPKLDTQFSVTSSGVSDDAALRRAADGEGVVTRHPSLSFQTRMDRQLPKRSSTHSGHLIPARWRRRKKAEVIWHPYVPPATSDQSLTDSGRPEVTCLISELDERRTTDASPQGSQHRFSVPSVFVQAPSFRRESPGGSRSRKTWADAAPFSRSWDDRNGCWTDLSPSPTECVHEPTPADHSPALTDPGPLFTDRGLSDPGPSLARSGSAAQLLHHIPVELDPCDTDGELFASAHQLEDTSCAEASDEDQFPLHPLPAVSSLPDFQRVAQSGSATSSLERKHSLPASANKRVQILEPSEVEQLAHRAVAATAATAATSATSSETPTASTGTRDTTLGTAGTQESPTASGPREPQTPESPGTSEPSGPPLGTSRPSGAPESGSSGARGFSGRPGSSGAFWSLGTQGPSEVQGPSGTPGHTGASGPSSLGTQGPVGAPGPPGAQEPCGAPGPPARTASLGAGEPPGPPSASVSPSLRRIEAQRGTRRKRQ